MLLQCNSLNIYCGNVGDQYAYLMYVNSLLYNYYENTYLIKHIRPMMIPTATTIINATTTPNTTCDTPLYSSVNIDGLIYDNCMIKKIVTLILSFPYVTAIQIIEVLLFFEKCRTSYFLSHEKD
jgi:hypothetical protein